MIFAKVASTSTLLHQVGNMETGKLYRLVFLLAFAAMYVPAESQNGKASAGGNQNSLTNTVSEMNAEMQAANAELLALIETLNQSLIAHREGANLVAFSSKNPTNLYPTTGSTFVFNETQLNEGDAYDTTTGEFTAPDDGVYMFDAHICNNPWQFIVYAINRNGNETLGVSTQWDDTGSCGSMSALARLNAGDRVFLTCDYCQSGVYLYENANRRNTFSGVRLH